MNRIENLQVNFSVSNMYYTYDGVLTKDQAFEMQTEFGYHPHGYGFFGYKVEGGVTTWNSFKCCD
tara:strand:- start:113 stop:307 length:195 start_codon:yes stop_codon:yes gene_type:complete